MIFRFYQSKQDETEERQRLVSKRLLDVTFELFQDVAVGY